VETRQSRKEMINRERQDTKKKNRFLASSLGIKTVFDAGAIRKESQELVGRPAVPGYSF
jgi:hypothetical protein